ncbi:MAG: type II toxin-antitoxin system VapC family toxin [Xanthobacteraceae bacterium]
MARSVLDASALLAFVNGETGAELIAEHLPDAVISSVNFSEAIAKFVSRSLSLDDAVRLIGLADVPVITFDRSLAEAAAGLITQTKQRGLSFADRACLALAARENVRAFTADRAWAGLSVGVEITVIR